MVHRNSGFSHEKCRAWVRAWDPLWSGWGPLAPPHWCCCCRRAAPQMWWPWQRFGKMGVSLWWKGLVSVAKMMVLWSNNTKLGSVQPLKKGDFSHWERNLDVWKWRIEWFGNDRWSCGFQGYCVFRQTHFTALAGDGISKVIQPRTVHKLLEYHVRISHDIGFGNYTTPTLQLQELQLQPQLQPQLRYTTTKAITTTTTLHDTRDV